MSPRIPVVNPRMMIRALERAGFVIQRQKGSHVILKRERDKKRVVVPNHSGDLNKGVTATILDQAGLIFDSFRDL